MKTRRLVRALGCFVAVLGMGAASSAQTQTGTTAVSWGAQDPAIGHLIGGPGDGTWVVFEGDPGFLSFGPYTTISSPGDYVAFWTLGALGRFEQVGAAVASLDVNDATTLTEIATRYALQAEFAAFTTNDLSLTFQTFTLPFTIDSTRAGHQFEFRVFWWGTSNSFGEQILGYAPLQWNAQNLSLGHQIGRADNGGWSASVFDGQGFAQYGPYTTLSAGNYQALWTLQVDNNTNDENAVVIVDVNDATTQTRLQSRQILRGEFLGVHTDQVFQLPFTIDSSRAGHQFEFRIFYTATSYVREQAVGVVKTP